MRILSVSFKMLLNRLLDVFGGLPKYVFKEEVRISFLFEHSIYIDVFLCILSPDSLGDI